MISSPDNKKSLWQYIKAKRQDHTGISTLKSPVNGEPISDSSSKADILNQYFKSVFTVEGIEVISLIRAHLAIHP